MLSDRHGNQINTVGDKVYLTLKKDNRKITLGKLNAEGEYIEVWKNPEKHLIRKLNGFGFNRMMLEKASTFKNIYLTLSTGENYLIPVEDALEKGQSVSFGKTGCEAQICLSLDVLEDYKVQ